MQPKDMPMQADDASGGDSQAGGGASQMVQDIHSKMMDLMDLMDKSQGFPDASKQKFASLIQAYQDFVDKDLGGEPEGDEQGPAPSPSGPVSPEAGGNPNAKPMY